MNLKQLVSAEHYDAMEEYNLTHCVCPIPLYDTNKSRIPPGRVQRKLDGALVEVHFQIKHFYLKSQLVNSFTGLIQRIEILRSAPPIKPKSHRSKPSKRALRVKVGPSRHEQLVAANTFLRPPIALNR